MVILSKGSNIPWWLGIASHNYNIESELGSYSCSWRAHLQTWIWINKHVKRHKLGYLTNLKVIPYV